MRVEPTVNRFWSLPAIPPPTILSKAKGFGRHHGARPHTHALAAIGLDHKPFTCFLVFRGMMFLFPTQQPPINRSGLQTFCSVSCRAGAGLQGTCWWIQTAEMDRCRWRCMHFDTESMGPNSEPPPYIIPNVGVDNLEHPCSASIRCISAGSDFLQGWPLRPKRVCLHGAPSLKP